MRRKKEPMLEMLTLLEVNQSTWVPSTKISNHAVRVLAPRKFKRKKLNHGIRITRTQ